MPQTTRMPTIAFDLDDVFSWNMHDLLKLYNTVSGDTLQPENITCWNAERFVKPGYEDFFEKTFKSPGWFRNVRPRQDMQSLIAALTTRARIIVVTAFYPSACLDKAAWLAEHYPTIDTRNLIFCNVKDCIHADLLFDDGTHNLVDFKGTPIVVDRPWNQDAIRTTDGRDIFRAFTADDIKQYLDIYLSHYLAN